MGTTFDRSTVVYFLHPVYGTWESGGIHISLVLRSAVSISSWTTINSDDDIRHFGPTQKTSVSGYLYHKTGHEYGRQIWEKYPRNNGFPELNWTAQVTTVTVPDDIGYAFPNTTFERTCCCDIVARFLVNILNKPTTSCDITMHYCIKLKSKVFWKCPQHVLLISYLHFIGTRPLRTNYNNGQWFSVILPHFPTVLSLTLIIPLVSIFFSIFFRLCPTHSCGFDQSGWSVSNPNCLIVWL